MANLRSSSLFSGYNISTMAGLIHSAKGNRLAVSRILLQGAIRNYSASNGSGKPITVEYPPSYSPF